MNHLDTKLTAFLDGFMAEYNMPGYDCAFWHRGKEIYELTKIVYDNLQIVAKQRIFTIWAKNILFSKNFKNLLTFPLVEGIE